MGSTPVTPQYEIVSPDQQAKDQYEITPPPEGALARAFHAVGSGFKQPFQQTAEAVRDVKRAISTKEGLRDLQTKYPPSGSMLKSATEAYGGLLPVDVRRKPEKDIDWPATVGASLGKIGAFLAMGKASKEALPKGGEASRAKALTQASGVSTTTSIPKSWETAVPELQRTVAASGKAPEASIPALNHTVQDTLTRTQNDFSLRLQPIAGEQRVPISISDSIRAKITPNMAQTADGQRMIKFLNNRAMEFEKPWTLRQLDAERMAATKRLRTMRNQAPSGQAAALKLSASAIADEAIEQGAQDIVYGALERKYAGQVPPDYFRNLKRTQSALIDIKDQLAKRDIQIENMKYAPLRERMRMHTYVSSGGHVGGAVGRLTELIYPEYKGAEKAAAKGLAPEQPKHDLRFLLTAPAAGVPEATGATEPQE